LFHRIVARHFYRLANPALFRCLTLSALLALLLAANAVPAKSTVPDSVLQWIAITNDAVLAGQSSPLVSTRVTALVSASVFDAVNGVDPRFQPLYVHPAALHPASQKAAAIQAAFAILVKVYPTQSASLNAHRAASLAALTESTAAIGNGIAWGQTVADTIWSIHLTDGIAPPPPPFLGADVNGVWRPTPLLNATGAAPQFATMTPWVLTRPSQFRLPPPPALNSPTFLADVEEVMSVGAFLGSGRSSDQSELALFWAGNTPLYWNRIASDLSASRTLSLVENARLFALLNVAMADAAIACWDGKYRFVFWRPITTIRTGIAGITADPSWVPWLDFFPTGTPPHPEYPSGHSTVSGAAAFVLAAEFGENTVFSVTSDVRPGTRTFASFTAATSEIADARVFGGIHFRTSCVRGDNLGRTVANYVSHHVFRLVDDEDQQ
jgi:hypothetical protein